MGDSNGRTENTEKILLWGLVFCHYNGRTVVVFLPASFQFAFHCLRWVAWWIRGHGLRLSSASG